MKYSRLDTAQLHELEKEFIDFLVVNGITADDWELLKKEENAKADAVLDQFSDVIWEGVLRKAQYLEKYTPSAIFCFKADESEIHLLKINDHRAIADLTNPDYRSKAIDGSMHITLQQLSKNYNSNREQELFGLIQSGCEITDGKLFESLN